MTLALERPRHSSFPSNPGPCTRRGEGELPSFKSTGQILRARYMDLGHWRLGQKGYCLPTFGVCNLQRAHEWLSQARKRLLHRLEEAHCWNSAFKPSIHRVSRESMTMIPRAPNEVLPVRVMGANSSSPIAKVA